jgi:hypothetical protein
MKTKYNYSTQLHAVALLMGAHPLTDTQGQALLKMNDEYINDYFQDIKPFEVVEAFKLCTTGAFHKVNPEMLGKTLNPKVIGKVLGNFREWRINENKYKAKYKQPDDRSDIITPLESWELCLKWYKEEGEPTLIAPYLGAYTYLVEQKLIKPIKKVSNKRFSDNFDSSEALAVKNYLKLKQ